MSASQEVRLAEPMAALSLATDLGMGQPLEQALRYCLLAVELARRVGSDARALSDVYYLALLEHLGCTATAPEIAVLNGGDELSFRSWGIGDIHVSSGEFLRHFVRHVGEGRSLPRRAMLLASGVVAGDRSFKRMVTIQCEGAARLADRLGMTKGVREGLGHYYKRWDGNGTPGGLAGEDVSLAQRVVIVAHDAVVHTRLYGMPSTLELIRRRRGAAYDPVVCDALLSDSEPLLAGDDADDAWARVLEAEPSPQRTGRPGVRSRLLQRSVRRGVGGGVG